MNHIFHDIDRDGWGSAALVIAQQGPVNCRLHPMIGKGMATALAGLKATASDTVWVLDLPLPDDPADLPVLSNAEVVWVDHHPTSRPTGSPANVRLILPATPRPTTTMSLLLASGQVSLPPARDFVRSLSRPDQDCPWGLVFDALRAAAPEYPVPLDELVRLLAEGPLGQEVPGELQGLISAAWDQQAAVERVLDQAAWEIGEHLAVVWLADAHGIALAQYCLAARQRQPGKLIAIVHRASTLYCGRDSQRPGPDLVRHFRGRQLDPKGHPYVCFVRLTKDCVAGELAALRAALKASGA